MYLACKPQVQGIEQEWCDYVAIEYQYTLGPMVTLTATASSTTPFSIRQRAQAKNPEFCIFGFIVSSPPQSTANLNHTTESIVLLSQQHHKASTNTLKSQQSPLSLSLSLSKQKACIFLQEWS
ncbi:hypothetical protein ACB094_05G192200 [Castanea mollissima]